nr:hypothetical protein [Clostridia bacterium]
MNIKEQIMRCLYEAYDILCEHIDIGKPDVFCIYYDEKQLMFFIGEQREGFIPITLTIDIAEIPPNKEVSSILERIYKARELIRRDTNCQLEFMLDQRGRSLYAETNLNIEATNDLEKKSRRIAHSMAKVKQYYVEDVVPYLSLFNIAINSTENLALNFEVMKCDAIMRNYRNNYHKMPVINFRPFEYELEDEAAESNEINAVALMLCLRKHSIPHRVSFGNDGTVVIFIPDISESYEDSFTFTCTNGDVFFGAIVEILEIEERLFYRYYAKLVNHATSIIPKNCSDFTISIIKEKPEIAILISNRLVLGKISVSALNTIQRANAFMDEYRPLIKKLFPRFKHIEEDL